METEVHRQVRPRLASAAAGVGVLDECLDEHWQYILEPGRYLMCLQCTLVFFVEEP